MNHFRICHTFCFFVYLSSIFHPLKQADDMRAILQAAMPDMIESPVIIKSSSSSPTPSSRSNKLLSPTASPTTNNL